MIQPMTRVKVADNTGAREAMCIRVLGRGYHEFAEIGDVCVITVKSANPRGMVKKKELHKAVIVRQKKNFRRRDGSAIRFDENAVVLVDAKKEPVATRIFGPMPRELTEKGFKNLMTMAEEIV